MLLYLICIDIKSEILMHVRTQAISQFSGIITSSSCMDVIGSFYIMTPDCHISTKYTSTLEQMLQSIANKVSGDTHIIYATKNCPSSVLAIYPLVVTAPFVLQSAAKSHVLGIDHVPMHLLAE